MSVQFEKIVIRCRWYEFLDLFMQSNLQVVDLDNKIYIYIYIINFQWKRKYSSPKYILHTLRIISPILGNIVLRNPFPLYTEISYSLYSFLSKKIRNEGWAFLPFVSIIGVSHIFFIVRLHLARFDGAVTRLKLHRESNVLAAAPRENARLHRPRGHGQFRRDGNRYVWLLESINNPLQSTKRKKKIARKTSLPRNF